MYHKGIFKQAIAFYPKPVGWVSFVNPTFDRVSIPKYADMVTVDLLGFVGSAQHAIALKPF
jgi:hypothetical protein